MSVSLPNGSTIGIATAYASPIAVSAISNASSAVATTATNAYTVGDFVEVTSGWSALNGRVVRVLSATATTVTLEGIDTSSTLKYPAGGGIGSLRKITGFTQLTQILTSAGAGGEQQFVQYQFLESDNESQLPSNKTALSMTFEIADDVTQPGYLIAKAANDDRLLRALKVTLKNGGVICHNAYVTVNDMPTLTQNEIMALTVTASMVCVPVRYAA